MPERIKDDRNGYEEGLHAADRAWNEGNLNFSKLESYLARLLQAQLQDRTTGEPQRGPPARLFGAGTGYCDRFAERFMSSV